MNEEYIEHWCWIINAVFRAESNILENWRDRLEKAKGTPEAEKTAQEYVKAIATELLSKGMDFEPDK